MKEDTQFRSTTVSTVLEDKDGWVITDAEGWTFFVPRKHGVVPQVGDKARFYGNGIGSIVRGLVLNDKPVFYRTEEEQTAQNQRDREQDDEDRRAKFEQNRTAMDADYDALPPVFRERIDKFRNTNPDFRWQYEDYEVFCCKEAVKIAGHMQTADKVAEFHRATTERQHELVPNLDDGHSGNTFGFACRLAALYLHNPTDVVLEHGALTPLVGCKKYGCPHPATTQEEEVPNVTQSH